MPRVLVIAYIFPPIGGSGVQRTVKFVKYLSECGWQPVVLSVSNPPLSEVDYSLLEELPADLPVYRTPYLDLLGTLRKSARRLKLTGRQPTAQAKPVSSVKPESSKRSPKKSKVRQALSNFAELWLQIPDRFVSWSPTALWRGLSLVKECDLIFSTSGPFTNHLVAYFLCKLSGKPWVADFRDPWTQYIGYQKPSKLRTRVDAFFEKRFLKTPDRVIVTCEATAVGFRKAYPFLPQAKFVEITNGFDADDFEQAVDQPFKEFTIVYTGRFNSEKNTSDHFLQALAELRHKCPEQAAKIKVIFAGLFGEQNYNLLKQLKLNGMVEPIGYVPHGESIKLLLRSHVSLLTLSDDPGVDLTYPGKLFEYLAARKTILALVPEGATADLIRKMDAGLIVSPDDVGAIKQAILVLYSQYEQGATLSKVYNNLQEFERRTLTRRFAQCLDAVLQNRGVIL